MKHVDNLDVDTSALVLRGQVLWKKDFEFRKL